MKFIPTYTKLHTKKLPVRDIYHEPMTPTAGRGIYFDKPKYSTAFYPLGGKFHQVVDSVSHRFSIAAELFDEKTWEFRCVSIVREKDNEYNVACDFHVDPKEAELKVIAGDYCFTTFSNITVDVIDPNKVEWRVKFSVDKVEHPMELGLRDAWLTSNGLVVSFMNSESIVVFPLDFTQSDLELSQAKLAAVGSIGR